VVYVRQSSTHQVLFNKESAEVQIGLRHLAILWGWPDDRVIVITEDQAQSGTTTEGRRGFQWLLTEVNLGHVGIILGFQVSRLSRANSDWYHLFERCAIFQTLLADFDGIYDPTLYNDRLLLGMKGIMTEAELHFMRQRLREGRLNKARRGELFTIVPTGYVRLPGDRVALDPDRQVQHVVRLVFDKFDELGSVGAVLRYMVRHDIKLGVRVRSGPNAGLLDWHPPLRSTLNTMLRRPMYAGCYVYGFGCTDPRRKKPGVPHSGHVRVEPMKWDVMIPDKVPAYISWERFSANQDRLGANRYLPTTRGAARSGSSLLSGLVYCGHCGRKMQVAYHTKAEPVRYWCNTRSAAYGGPTCQSFAGGPLEKLVTEEVLQALEPAKLELSFGAVADLQRERQRLDQHWQDRLERARTETQRAARQYNAVEPEDRLVARELERRWEQALRALRTLEEQYERFLADTPRQPTAAERRRIEAWAADLPGLWNAPSTTNQDRKTIVRHLVEQITVTVRGQTEWVDVQIRWAGGIETRHHIRRPVKKYEQLSNYMALRARMVDLRCRGVSCATIAEYLNREGFHPPRGADRFNRFIVDQFLARQPGQTRGTTSRIKDGELRPHERRLSDLARELRLGLSTLRGWLARGWVLGRKTSGPAGCWVLRVDDREVARLRRLRDWRPGGYNRQRPPELTTPLGPESDKASHPAGARGRLERQMAKNKARTHK
jgi:DNA invertase Pin-like site-specific DNA recombinase